ncbi:hypothetical protein IGI42_004300 [Enterococcus sp. AZ109]
MQILLTIVLTNSPERSPIEEGVMSNVKRDLSEKRFAKVLSYRVIFMTNGVIYEEDTYRIGR